MSTEITIPSFILAGTTFVGLIGFYANFSDKIKYSVEDKKKKTFENMADTISKKIEEASSTTCPKTCSVHKDSSTTDPSLQDFFRGLVKDTIKQRGQEDLLIADELKGWLKNMVNSICISIALFMVTGIIGLSYYGDPYSYYMFIAATIFYIYGIYKFSQIVTRTSMY